MKKSKLFVSLLLTISIVLSVSICAFAMAPPDYVVDDFKRFQYIEQGHSSSYVRIMQRFLLNYNSRTSNFISQNGGVDGTFGLGTYYATYEFQSNVFNNSSDWDGKVGSKTWGQVCENMDFYNVSGEGTHYKFYIGNNLIVWRIANIWSVMGGDGLRYDIYV